MLRAKALSLAIGATITIGAVGTSVLYLAACRFSSGLTGAPDLPSDAGAPMMMMTTTSPPPASGGCDAADLTSVANCGACGNVCNPGPNAFAACIAGACVTSCAPSMGDCDDAGDNGCETNTNASRNHCGRCGHDCLGGVCTLGVCQPVTLAVGVDAPVHFAMDDTDIYGINSFGTVTRVSKDGGALTPLSPVGDVAQSPAPRISISAGNVYYTHFSGGPVDAGADAAPSGAVMSVPQDGGAAHLVIAAAQPYAIVATPTTVYWTEGNPNQSVAPTGTVKRCTLPDCPGSVETMVPTASGRVFGIAVDATNLYWTNGGTPPSLADSAVRKCALSACSPVVLATAPNGPTALTLDKTSVYWVTASDVIATCLIAGCSVTPSRLDTSQFNPRFLTLDGNTIYWTSSDGTLKSLPKLALPSAEKVLFQDRSTSPWDIAVDGAAIYFTDLNSIPGLPPGPALRRLAR